MLDVDNSLKEQLKLSSIVCPEPKTKFNAYASFHVCCGRWLSSYPQHKRVVWWVFNNSFMDTLSLNSRLAAPASGLVVLSDEAHGEVLHNIHVG